MIRLPIGICVATPIQIRTPYSIPGNGRENWPRSDTSASEYRDNVANLMTKEQIAEAQKLAREWMAAHPDQ